MSATHTPPSFQLKAFNCPHCAAYAQHNWNIAMGSDHNWSGEVYHARCRHCWCPSIWVNGSMVYPLYGMAPHPNVDLSADLVADYNEARSILAVSPRGAAALLRLLIQKLCAELGAPGKNINSDIAFLVQNGLSTQVQRALDAVRVIGNESVHPGKMDLRDDPDTALALFSLVNIIVQRMVSETKQIDEIYAMLPADKVEGIEQRDNR